MTTTVRVEVESDDGVVRVERVLHDGIVIGKNVIDLVAGAGAAVLEARRDVLRAQLDPTQPDPTPKALADAQAFVALAADVGVAEAASVAGVTLDVAIDATPVKGGLIGG